MPRYIISRLPVPVAEKRPAPRCYPLWSSKPLRGFDQLSCYYTDEQENSLEFITESVYFIKADSHEGVYEFLFYVFEYFLSKSESNPVIQGVLRKFCSCCLYNFLKV